MSNVTDTAQAKTEQPSIIGGRVLATSSPIKRKSIRKMMMTTNDLAQSFLEDKRSQGRCLRRHREKWYQYLDGCYQTLSDEEFDADLYQYLVRQLGEVSKGLLADVRLAVKSHAMVPSTYQQGCWLGPPDDAPKGTLIAVENGLLDIDAAILGDRPALRSHSSEWFSTIKLPYEYIPTADCRYWKSTLETNLDGDQARIAICQELVGYCLDPNSTRFQKFGLLQGPAGTGKSSFLMGLTAILGVSNCSALKIEQIGLQFAPQDLLGKFANIAAETGEFSRINEAQLRELVDGSLRLFDRKHKSPISAHNRAKLIFACNDLPHFSDRSNAIWRRMIIIPFNRIVDEYEKDRRLAEPGGWAEAGELPGMLNWAIEGLARLRRQNGFTVSDACNSMLSQHKEDCNSAQQYLLDHYEERAGAIAYVDDLYVRYRIWCDNQRIDRPLAKHTFGREVHRTFKGLRSDRESTGMRRRFHEGIAAIRH